MSARRRSSAIAHGSRQRWVTENFHGWARRGRCIATNEKFTDTSIEGIRKVSVNNKAHTKCRYKRDGNVHVGYGTEYAGQGGRNQHKNGEVEQVKLIAAFSDGSEQAWPPRAWRAILFQPERIQHHDAAQCDQAWTQSDVFDRHKEIGR
jgi:hypothetical protein